MKLTTKDLCLTALFTAIVFVMTFVPKILAVFLGLILMGHWIMNEMVQYMVDLWSNFGLYIR